LRLQHERLLPPKKKQKSMETQTLTPVPVLRLRDQAAIKQAAVYLNYFSLRQQQQTSQVKRSVS